MTHIYTQRSPVYIRSGENALQVHIYVESGMLEMIIFLVQ